MEQGVGGGLCLHFTAHLNTSQSKDGHADTKRCINSEVLDMDAIHAAQATQTHAMTRFEININDVK